MDYQKSSRHPVQVQAALSPLSPQPPKGRDSNTRVLRWAAAASLVGALLIYNSVDASSEPSPATTPVQKPQAAPAPSASKQQAPEAPPAAAALPTAPSGPSAGPRGPALPRSAPTRLQIPAVGIDAPFTDLKLNQASGELNAPPADDNNLVGWFVDGASPGERGNAIVAGHVDTKTGPAVFFPLSSLKKGNKVTITRNDGIVASFVVDKIDTFAKNAFPNDLVYGDTNDAQLRLITCGGAYDHNVKDYTANVVVFAHLDSFKWT
ncbi:class F sortase [Streptomyces sp. LX-29]|uniref:class F sortase n=1 Tax=Streptomyces sp. LX-29 TaxID=2900152 RepID=UPI00240E79B1|nr:class F sortase [Streptomyces sp. LX-29]WFB06770.1 class F sortase [Streptomyces sp. LX-29]